MLDYVGVIKRTLCSIVGVGEPSVRLCVLLREPSVRL